MNTEHISGQERAAKKCTWISVAVNLLLTALQVVVGFITGSQGLIADGIHSLSDLVADGVVLVAVHHGKQAPDKNHHYGHHRYENLASMVLGLLLVFVGIGMVWAAIGKLREPESIQQVGAIALWVAGGALVAKELLFRYMLSVAQKVRSTLLIANAWHARADAASSLVVGVGIAGNMMGLTLLDPIAALIVGTMVFKMGTGFTLSAIHDLTDVAADDEITASISETILRTNGVIGCHDLKTRKSGDLIHVDVHLEIDGNITVREGHEIANRVRHNVMSTHPVLYVMTHVDPV